MMSKLGIILGARSFLFYGLHNFVTTSFPGSIPYCLYTLLVRHISAPAYLPKIFLPPLLKLYLADCFCFSHSASNLVISFPLQCPLCRRNYYFCRSWNSPSMRLLSQILSMGDISVIFRNKYSCLRASFEQCGDQISVYQIFMQSI